MHKKLLLALLLCCLGAFAKDGFQPLFNGKNLDGWDGDPRLWKAQDGMIVGSTEGAPLEYNSFLMTKKSYANFILKAQAKLRNHNSGIQFRSEEVPGLRWAVRGYQADMAEDNYWGCIYEERGKRGVMVRYRVTLRRRSHQSQSQRPGNRRPPRFRQTGWNHCAPVAQRSADAGLFPQFRD